MPCRTTLALALPLAFLAALAGCEPARRPRPASAPVWSVVESARPEGVFHGVWGSEHTDVYAVGGQRAAGLMLHFDGRSWSMVAMPPATPMLTAIHGTSSTQAVAVGLDGTALHYDGTGWVARPTGTTQPLWGIWCASGTAAWAVGGDASTAAVLLRWDGVAWAAQPPYAHTLAQGVRAYYAVWGPAATDVYLAGQGGALLHFDGAAWSERAAGLSEDLLGLWGTTATEVCAVGGRADPGRLAEFDGAAWGNARTVPGAQGLRGVWCDPTSPTYVCGGAGYTATVGSPGAAAAMDSPVTDRSLLDIWACG